jgi:hypothetical protein
VDGEHGVGEVEALDLGGRVGVFVILFEGAPESDAEAWRLASCASCALFGGVGGDGEGFEDVDAPMGFMSVEFDKA